MTPMSAIEIAVALAVASALVFALARKHRAHCERQRTMWHALRAQAENRLPRFCPVTVSTEAGL